MGKREYQTKAVAALRRDLRKHERVLAVAPTGAGKTVIASMLVNSARFKRVLWLAHRHELVSQAYETLTGLGLTCGVLMAADGPSRVNRDAPVQVASVQTLSRRGVNAKSYDLVVIDEAHRAASDSYRAIVKGTKGARLLGLTATPCRLDGKGLGGELFAFMRVMATAKDLYRGGFLRKPKAIGAPAVVLEEVLAQLEGARTIGGDFSKKSLGKVNTSFLVGSVAKEAMKWAPGVPKVVFASSIEHSLGIVEAFKRRRVKAAHLDGETPMDERVRLLSELGSSKVEVVSNVDVLTEGWDLPQLGAVIIARPTRSFARFMQMVGRVQRPWKGPRPVVIDHGANIQRFDYWPGEDVDWSLDEGLERDVDPDDPRVKSCTECGALMAWGASECEDCGAEVEVKRTPAQERLEYEAELAEIRRKEQEEIIARVKEFGRRFGYTPAQERAVIAKLVG